MSDIDTRLDEIATLNKLAHPELDGACYICGINPTLIKQLMADEFEKLIDDAERKGEVFWGNGQDKLRQKLKEWKK